MTTTQNITSKDRARIDDDDYLGTLESDVRNLHDSLYRWDTDQEFYDATIAPYVAQAQAALQAREPRTVKGRLEWVTALERARGDMNSLMRTLCDDESMA